MDFGIFRNCSDPIIIHCFSFGPLFAKKKRRWLILKKWDFLKWRRPHNPQIKEEWVFFLWLVAWSTSFSLIHTTIQLRFWNLMGVVVSLRLWDQNLCDKRLWLVVVAGTTNPPRLVILKFGPSLTSFFFFYFIL